MIIFCHLRWNFVYQRPQHIISRLSEYYKILMVEEPLMDGERGTFDLEIINSNLTILKPKVDSILDIRRVLDQLNLKKFDTAWFYSPAFVDLIPYLKINTIIYDCMDELSQFKGASLELRTQEKFLIQEADLIFTGGKSLYEAKAKFSNDVHCFPSSVDIAHFKTVHTAIPIPRDIQNISKPIVGYIGVIDERIDLDLIAKTAAMLEDVSFVMVGPLAKIGEAELPRATNIHYLGMKTYNELPNYLNAFDIAMMPFALNEATEYISPTKTLEYMAADKPVISTAIKDVVRDYSETINIVGTSQEFSDAITTILNSEITHDKIRYRRVLENTSWDVTVKKMRTLLKQLTK